ncbi:hypothetical protein CJ030_MR6G028560 [Morella rubra]|uniref:Putative plant transposon protein domain-containing protein n=1 Tax=Morella rubra TaxID=262757 RepID=A0A6A1VCV0_9ROSI|nr:hypothetical protein CJ030_MR6G028560 [Morella rubra]
MVKRKQPAGSSSKPTKVPRKSKPRPFDASRFVDARASELFHSTFHNRKVIVEREVLLAELPVATVSSYFSSRHWDPFLQDLTHLVPPTLLVREFYSNFFDVDEASLSFSVFIRGQRLRVSPDVIASLFGVVRVPEPVYPYVESSREPPSFDAMSLLLFGRPYPYAGGTLFTSDFSAENHVVSRIALTNLYPVSHLSSISLTRVRFLYALLIDCHASSASTQASHSYPCRHARATERNTRAVSRLHRLIRPLVGADALPSDISSSSESSASSGASAPSFEVPAAESVADPSPRLRLLILDILCSSVTDWNCSAFQPLFSSYSGAFQSLFFCCG